MTTILVDEEPGTRLPPPPGFIPPTIRKLLDKGFEGEADFYLLDGRPCAVFPMLDYATDWSRYPIRELHPFVPIIDGREITEAEFRALVKAMHAIE